MSNSLRKRGGDSPDPMPYLEINDFSCISQARIELRPITLIIGPQASGKSVISKLMYFCVDAISNYFSGIEDFNNIDDYRSSLADRFSEWFPPEAWGKGKFSIRFIAGPLSIHILRSNYAGKVNQKVNVRLSTFLTEIYELDFDAFRAQTANAERETRPVNIFQALFAAQRSRRKFLSDELGEDYIEAQQFIPAGRSFFTNVGKAVAAFEQARTMEPFTIDFGRHFTLVRETMGAQRIFRRATPPEIRTDLDSMAKQFLEPIMDGEIIIEKNREYLKTRDGRVIQFQHLSSGQQEALPLVLSVLYHIEYTVDLNSILYIEEPEAHLFPTTQDTIVRFLSRIASSKLYRVKMMITTHSPYVLAKINNLLKAGSLASIADNRLARRIEAVVPQAFWLNPEDVAAYAIKKGSVVSIMEEDGMIDGDYLDSVSEYMSDEFSGLLELDVSE
jgi:hypothetical protein